MKIGFVSDSLSSTAGGIFEIERSLALHLRKLGPEVEAWGVDDERWAEDRASWEDIPCHINRRKGPRIFGYVPDLVGQLAGSSCDLLHLQHLWMYPSVAVHRWHKRTGRPYLVTANGMLEPWTLSSSRLNKRLAALLYENRMLHAAACLQANTEKEAADFRAYGLKNPICLIPNGVALPRVKSHGSWVMGQEQRVGSQGEEGKHPQSEGRKKVLLFLGRLHPKKGLVNALRAWSKVRGQESGVMGQDEWQFVIAGWDQGGHGEELKALCRELGLSYSETPASKILTSNNDSGTIPLRPPGHGGQGTKHEYAQRIDGAQRNQQRSTKHRDERVAFVGPVFGDEKDALLRHADAFILPSFSEGLPMAVLEAWAYGLPVLMTDHCNLSEGFAANAAIRIGTDPGTIAEGMRELFQESSQDLAAMGAKGRTLVEDRFTWPKVAAQMKEVYEWMLGGGEKPGSVL
jgi:glycosyltransferase involved in cell wall biosynthesis